MGLSAWNNIVKSESAMNKKILLILLLFLSVSAFSQNIDSLYSLYTKSNKETRLIFANQIAQTVYDLQCTDTLFQLTNETSDLLSNAIVNELMGSYAMYIKVDYELSNKFTLEAAKIYEQLKDTLTADIMYGNMANNYLRMGNYEQAIELLQRCYELEKKVNDMAGLSVTLNSLGIAYSRCGYSQAAIDYFQQALEIERPLNRPMQYATRLASLAKEYMKLEQYEKSLSLIKEALVYDEKIERREKEERIAVHRAVMGDIYHEMDSLSQAGVCYNQAIGVFTKNNQNNRLAEIFFSIGKLYMKKGDSDKAIQWIKQCANISEKHTMKLLQQDSYRLLYEIYRQKQGVSPALIYLEKYKALEDSLLQESTQKQMNEFRVKYDTQKKELEIIQQQAQINKQQTKQTIYIGGLIVAGILLVLFICILVQRTKRNRDLAEINATKDKFFSIISHDLKNPAIAQRNALEQLLNHADKWHSDFLLEYYEKLLKSADQQVELLYNLLNWAQLQTGRMPYNPIKFNLVTQIEEEIKLVQNRAKEKNIDIETSVPETAIVTADRNMLAVIFRNLLENAVKFTEKGGKISVEIAQVKNGAYRIRVNDTGIGMSKEQINDLFRIDKQQSQSGTAGEKGSGLGLIIVKELIEKHGSSLTIESNLQKGSSFSFVISQQN